MRFIETELAGAFIVEPERIEDERGFFARTWCAREFEAQGLEPRLAQCSVSFNRAKGTLRGLHFQKRRPEAKLVRCTRGTAWDVIVDLRRDSPSFGRWVAVELGAENRRAIYVPAGLAHGFQTLADDCELLYQMSEFFDASLSGGVRWDDADLAIAWPLPVAAISQRDRELPRLGELESDR
jgi:dTDP-4-dehydrorhamnose 3,5-epimerase